ncbi:MAG: ATP-binding protein, partial [Armatimonadetes bacterium]|nr:ATP-binding protein [Armatimonadota bacterium]
ATQFGAEFYRRLTLGRPLEEAVLLARGRLRQARFGARESRDWHRPRLLLGPSGGGVLCRGSQFRIPDPHRVAPPLPHPKRTLPAAPPHPSVGRRREIQEARWALLRQEGAAGCLLLHGPARQGKSSLTEQLANSLPDHRPVVLHGDRCRSVTLLDRLSEVLADLAEFPEWERTWRTVVVEEEAQLRYALAALLTQVCTDRTPLLVILDDFEQCLEAPRDGGSRTVRKEHRALLSALLAALSLPGSRSALLISSRYDFLPPGDSPPGTLHPLSLPPMSAEDCRKQLHALDASVSPGENATPEQVAVLRQRHWEEERIVNAAAGQPFLLRLLCQAFQSDRVAGEAALTALEEYRRVGNLPTGAVELRSTLEYVVLGHLLDCLSPAEHLLLRLSLLYPTPLPPAATAALASLYDLTLPDTEPGSRLTGFGLWVRVPDLVNPEQPAAGPDPAVLPCVRRRLGDLSREEVRTAARTLLPPLIAAWGRLTAASSWPPAAREACLRLALWAEHQAAILALAEPVVRCCKREHRLAAGLRWAYQALRLLDRTGMEAPLGLLSIAVQLADRSGPGERADRLIYRAIERLDRDPRPAVSLSARDRGEFRLAAGRWAWHRGDLEEAERNFQMAASAFRWPGLEREAGIARGYRADLYQARGDLEKALRIHRKECLPISERAHGGRLRAVTWGKIADIHEARGDLAKALHVRREKCLPLYERLQDVRSRAVTWGKIADVHRARGNLEEARRIWREECLRVYDRFQDVRERAVTWGKIADIQQTWGNLDEALHIQRRRCLADYERLQDVRSCAVTWWKIANLNQAQGDLVEALQVLRTECLPVFERLQDVRSCAVIRGKIASIYHARGELGEALRILEGECLPALDRQRDVRECGILWGLIADINQARGELGEALRVLQTECLPAFDGVQEVRSRAITWTKIADICQARGDLDEARRILEDECLPAFARQGDVRSRTITQARIADIHFVRGNLEIAQSILDEGCLQAVKRVGDSQARAVVWGKIADTFHAEGDLEYALHILERKCLRTFRRLQDVRSCAIIRGKIADIYEARCELDDALRIRREECLP